MKSFEKLLTAIVFLFIGAIIMFAISKCVIPKMQNVNSIVTVVADTNETVVDANSTDSSEVCNLIEQNKALIDTNKELEKEVKKTTQSKYKAWKNYEDLKGRYKKLLNKLKGCTHESNDACNSCDILTY